MSAFAVQVTVDPEDSYTAGGVTVSLRVLLPRLRKLGLLNALRVTVPGQWLRLSWTPTPEDTAAAAAALGAAVTVGTESLSPWLAVQARSCRRPAGLTRSR